MPGTRAAPAALSGAPFGIDQGAQVVEAVGRDHSSRHQFPERGFDFGLQLVRAADDVGEKRSSALAQEIQHLPRALAQTAGFGLLGGGIDAESSSRPLRERKM